MVSNCYGRARRAANVFATVAAPLLIGLVIAQAGCLSESDSEPESADEEPLGQAQQALDPTVQNRRIPLRFIEFYDPNCIANGNLCQSGWSCDGSDASVTEQAILDNIATANERFAGSGISFYLRERHEIPSAHLWCFSSEAKSWAQVQGPMIQAFPHISPSAWHPDTSKGGGQAPGGSNWYMAVAGTLADHDEIPVFIGRSAEGKSDGNEPQTGRAMHMSKGAFGTDSNVLAHELGHYLSLDHTNKDPSSDKDPRTEQPWKLSDHWDLVVDASGPVPDFFTSKSEAALSEASLQPLDPFCTQPENSCQVECQILLFTYFPGSPLIAGMSRIGPTTFSKNLMRGGGTSGLSCDRFYSQSQFEMMWAHLDYELTAFIAGPATSEFENRVGLPLPAGFPETSLLDARPRLGLVRGKWSHGTRNFCTSAGDKLYTGDFDGNGREDLLCNEADGDMRVDLSNTKGEFWSAEWSQVGRNFCVTAGEKLYVGDFNGDGRDDLLCNQSDGDMFIDLADTSGRFTGSNWSKSARNFCVTSGEKLYVGDFNGDGREDLLCNQADGDMFVDLADPTSYFSGSNWSMARNFCVTSSETLYVGKFNSDARADLLCNQADGDMLVDFASTAGTFTGSDWTRSGRNFCQAAGSSLLVGDLNADGRDDLMCRAPTSTTVDLANASGEFWSNEFGGRLDGWSCTGSGVRAQLLGNADGQHGADIICNWGNGMLEVARLRMD